MNPKCEFEVKKSKSVVLLWLGLNIGHTVSGKNTDKKGLAQEGTSALRQFHFKYESDKVYTTCFSVKKLNLHDLTPMNNLTWRKQVRKFFIQHVQKAGYNCKMWHIWVLQNFMCSAQVFRTVICRVYVMVNINWLKQQLTIKSQESVIKRSRSMFKCTCRRVQKMKPWKLFGSFKFFKTVLLYNAWPDFLESLHTLYMLRLTDLGNE